MQNSTAIVLLNLGSPASPEVRDVRSYLKQFLNDPYVIDLPYLFRKMLVDGFILNTRPKNTAEAYQKIWTKEGSPLLTHTKALAEKLQKKINKPVFYTMRYGTPSIPDTLAELKKSGATKIIFIPLYPQYSFAASDSSIVEFKKWQEKILPNAKTQVIEDFYNVPGFITALAESMRNEIETIKPDLLMLSYHGIPERHLAKATNGTDYRDQCYETSRLLAKELGLTDSQYFVAFQSRLGRTKWIEPYTDIILQELPKKGVKRLLVASPSFTADCLETLEEIQIRYKELFINSGGEFFQYLPCVNSSSAFVNAVAQLVDQSRSVN